MKKNYLLYFLFILLLSSLLSACTGGVTTPTNWPGVTVDMERDTVYIAYGQHVYAVNLANGTEKWRFPSEGDNKVTFFANPGLTESGDQLIIGGYDSRLYSIDPESGLQRWIFEDAEKEYIAGPLVNSEQIFAPNADNQLYVLELSGTLSWKFATSQALWGSPVINGERVYLTSMDHHLYALEKSSGEQAWKSEDLGGAMAGDPTLSPDGVLYMGTFGNQLVALNSADGSELWRFEASNWIWSGPALVGDDLYFGDLSGTLYLLNAEDGTPRWQVQPDSSERRAISNRPLVIGDTLYFVTDGGALFAIDAETGATRWTQTIEGRLFTAPVVAGETILVAPVDTDAILYAFGLNGTQKWQFTPAE